MGSATVPVDRAFLSSYRLSIVTVSLSVTVWLQFSTQILTGGSDPNLIPQISPFHWGLGPLFNAVLLGTTRVSVPSVTDVQRQMDHAT